MNNSKYYVEILDERQRRQELANRIKALDDVVLPRLDAWNYGACEAHKDVGPQVDCQFRKCGGELFSHQRVAIAWAYALRYGLIADEPGCGKTSVILGLLALLKQKGELQRRAVIIPNTPAVPQWGEELARWTPGLKCITVDGSILQDKRIDLYSSDWEVLILGQHIAMNDLDLLEVVAPFDLVVSDDVDALLNHSNTTHKAIREISKDATRSFTVNATALQIRIQQLHAALVPVRGYDTFGSLKKFENHYIREEKVTEWVDGKQKKYRKATGFKNLPELIQKTDNIHIRRKASDLNDVRMPELMPPVVEWFEMSPQQRALYSELQRGVLTLLREEGTTVKHTNALTKFLYGQQICAGLPALGLPDGPGASPKLDRLFHNLSTVWNDRKVVVFVKNVGMVRAAIGRAMERDMGIALVWGQKQNAAQRKDQITKFWDDPNCNLLIGTTSLERSLNLQISNTVVALDTHLNPQRMRQILGRAKRAGSAHEHVFFFTYLMQDTQESRYLQVLAERAALYDAVFNDENEMYRSLTGTDLLRLVSP